MPRRIFITVAEVSGDKHAAGLIRSLKNVEPDLIIEGLGGPEMEAAGAVIHQNTVTRAAMGIRGALRALEVMRLLRWTRRHFDQHPPDLWVGVDSPSMNFHFAKVARERNVPTFQYVAPQLWAWAEWRMAKLKRLVDFVACILPFEERYFRAHGVNAAFVGHPLFDELPPERLGQGGNGSPRTWGREGAAGRPPVIGLLPGSRQSEAEGNFPGLLAAAAEIERAFPDAQFLTPTTPATHPVVQRRLADRAAGIGPRRVEVAQGAFDQMVPRCDLCLTVSGTATLHVASFGVPMIIVYRGNRVLWNAIGRWLIRTRTYGLVNLLAANANAGLAAAADGSNIRPAGLDARSQVVPELIPWYGDGGQLAQLAIGHLRDPSRLEAQKERLATMLRSLDRPGASDAVARLALEQVRRTDRQITTGPLPSDP